MNKQILKGIIFVGLFALPFVPFLVSSSFFFPFITTKAFAFRIIVEIIFGAWVIWALTDPEYRPKRSPILYAVIAFLFIVGLADALGVAPMKSFWSNFERMEGFVTMLHLGALFLVMSSVLKEKEWSWWWNTTLAASALMICYCLLQLSGSSSFPIHQGGVRVDGTIGNASYLALYLLIHIFVAIFFFVRSRTSGMRWTYGALIFGQIMILYFTATRGAILGLLGGLFLIALLNVRNKANPKVESWSRYLFIGLVVFAGFFFLIRNTTFVKNSAVLSRFSTLSVSEWKTEGRAFVWPIAIAGIKEKPILGWGQDNFNYVFAEHYSAKMFNLEPWFDRAHNIFLDWAIAAGGLGLLSYLLLYVVLLWSIWKKDSLLTHIERSVLTGLIAAYFFNNIFVFDNLISYVLFISLLSYMHARVGRAWPEQKPLSESAIFGASIPIALVVIAALYFVNIKPIIANNTLIQALQAAQTQGQTAPAIKYFEKAYNGSPLGRSETVEWISSSAINILSDEKIPMQDRNAYFTFAKEAIEKTTQDLAGDPRYEIVAGTFYSSVGSVEDASRHFNKAKEEMPEKQIIYFNLGQLALQNNQADEALNYFKQAYDLAPGYEEAKVVYLIGALYAKNNILINKLLNEINPVTLITDTRPLTVMFQTGQKTLLLTTLNTLLQKIPKYKTEIEGLIQQASAS